MNKRLCAWCVAICLGAAAPTAVAQQVATEDDLPVLTLDIAYDPNDALNRLDASDPTALTREFGVGFGASFVRVHLILEQGTLRTAQRLAILDGSGILRDTLLQDRFGPDGAWTLAVPGNRLTVQLVVTSREGEPIRIRADHLHYQSTQPAPQAVLGRYANFVDLVKSFGVTSKYFAFGGSVAYVSFLSKESHKDTNCSGFLIAPALVITNAHCIDADSQLPTAFVQFHYEGSAKPAENAIRISSIPLTNPDLDYTLLRLATRPADVAVAALATGDVKRLQPLALIQHPNGAPKMIDVTVCDVAMPRAIGLKAALMSDLGHRCDSEGGSSGSPLMDRQTGEVVGLHHMARRDPAAGVTLNYAVAIQEILSDVCGRDRSIFNEITGVASTNSGSCPGGRR